MRLLVAQAIRLRALNDSQLLTLASPFGAVSEPRPPGSGLPEYDRLSLRWRNGRAVEGGGLENR